QSTAVRERGRIRRDLVISAVNRIEEHEELARMALEDVDRQGDAFVSQLVQEPVLDVVVRAECRRFVEALLDLDVRLGTDGVRNRRIERAEFLEDLLSLRAVARPEDFRREYR